MSAAFLHYPMKQIVYHFHISGNYYAGNHIDMHTGLPYPTCAPETPADNCADTSDSLLKIETILSIPPEGNYTAVRKYIEERKRFDQEFATFAKISSRVELCKRLSAEFGWTVDHYALGRNINRNRQ